MDGKGKWISWTPEPLSIYIELYQVQLKRFPFEGEPFFHHWTRKKKKKTYTQLLEHFLLSSLLVLSPSKTPSFFPPCVRPLPPFLTRVSRSFSLLAPKFCCLLTLYSNPPSQSEPCSLSLTPSLLEAATPSAILSHCYCAAVTQIWNAKRKVTEKGHSHLICYRRLDRHQRPGPRQRAR